MSSPDDIAKALAGVIGKNDEEATVSQYLDTGFPPLNEASSADWGGGLAVGRVIEIAGPPSSGKTAIATRAMAAAQAAGGVAGFCDHERSFSIKLAPRLGLDVTPRSFRLQEAQHVRRIRRHLSARRQNDPREEADRS